MPTLFNWLHLSDLHLGNTLQKPLWPTFRTTFYKDLQSISPQLGKLDVVFFTGDFVQVGTSQQFSEVSRELETIWKEFAKCGLGEPVLFPIPGNHDLIRPAENSSISVALAEWHKKTHLHEDFWTNPESEYRKAVDGFFENYTAWLASSPVPLPTNLKRGILPGDISAKIKKESSTLAVVGLNSTFLQIRKGDMREQLDLSVYQLNPLCENDPDGWLRESQVAVLLTHQPVSWLSKDAQSHFNREIYTPGRFFSHLYGHQHAIEVSDISMGGAEPKRSRQAPSIFGLDKYGDDERTTRTHGYIAGKFEITGPQGMESLWPRRAEEGMSGNLRIRSDQRFDLNEEGFISTPFEIELPETNAPLQPVSTTTEKSIDILGAPIDAPSANARLASCPQLQLVPEPQHAAIRQEEQAGFEHSLLQKRVVCVVAGWGVGQDGFINSALSRFKPKIEAGRIYHIKCEDAIDSDSFQSVFLQQAGLSLQTFASCVSALEEQYLVLDNIGDRLITGSEASKFRGLVQALLDYSPKLRIVVITDTRNQGDDYDYIEIKSLEVPEVKSYLTAHPLAAEVSSDITPVELIFDKTDGLPVLIDRFLKRTKVSSIREALEDEESCSGDSRSAVANDLPQALSKAVSMLPRSSDKNLVRAFRLLKVLTVLPFGETMESVKRFFPTEPFFPVHAIALNDMSLLDVIPLNRATPDIRLSLGHDNRDAPKLLKVPRRVREFVRTLLSDDERKDIINSGLELCFGKKWRHGTIKMRTVPVEYQEYLDHGLGNEFALLEYLLKDAATTGDPNSLKRVYRPAVFYARHLQTRDRFHDLTMVAGSLLPLLDSRMDQLSWSEMARLYGSGLRMTGKAAQAISYFDQAISVGGEKFSKEEKAAILVELTYAHERIGNKEKAIAAANTVLEMSDDKSPNFYAAKETIASLSLHGEQRQTELRHLESSARQNGLFTAANNIALDLARTETQGESKRKILDRVLQSEDAGYTRWRGIVEKGRIVEQGEVNKMNSTDRYDLVHAYAYLHAQRFGTLFDQCHDVVWSILESEGKSDQLLRLFRHSSFVWRIRGVEKREAQYAERLSKIPLPDAERTSLLGAEKAYFLNRLRRLSALITSLVEPKA